MVLGPALGLAGLLQVPAKRKAARIAGRSTLHPDAGADGPSRSWHQAFASLPGAARLPCAPACHLSVRGRYILILLLRPGFLSFESLLPSPEFWRAPSAHEHAPPVNFVLGKSVAQPRVSQTLLPPKNTRACPIENAIKNLSNLHSSHQHSRIDVSLDALLHMSYLPQWHLARNPSPIRLLIG
jgi:hypothetical protein